MSTRNEGQQEREVVGRGREREGIDADLVALLGASVR